MFGFMKSGDFKKGYKFIEKLACLEGLASLVQESHWVDLSSAGSRVSCPGESFHLVSPLAHCRSHYSKDVVQLGRGSLTA
jgi:hypothetical protein